MEKEQNLNKMAFKDYYDTLSDDAKETVRNRILGKVGCLILPFIISFVITLSSHWREN